VDAVFLAAALTGQVTDWLDSYGPILFYVIVWGLVFAGTGLLIGAFIPFITGDSLIFAAGLLAATSDSVEIQVLTVGIGLAAFIGDQTGFVLGRHFGRPYLDKREGPKLKSAIAKSEKFYYELGWWAVVVSRFMPWARVLIPAIAGIARMNYYKFLSANFVGAISWGVGLSLAGYYAATIPAVKTGSYAIATFFIVGSIIAGVRSWLNNRKLA
jgi:membrane-associated protein